MRKKPVKANPRKVQDADVALGERIRARRNQIALSQGELGEALGVSFQQIQKYEKGMNRISSGRLMQIAYALQCSITDLLRDTSNGSIKSTPFSRYAASKEGVALINAMTNIPSAALRREVLNLAERLSASFQH